MKEIESWLSEEERKQIFSADYWNDIENEKKKEWWIQGGNYQPCLNYLERSKLMDEYRSSEPWLKSVSGSDLEVLDLAAGIGWTSALISKLNNVKTIHAVELSQHRLELFEEAFQMLEGKAEKCQRYSGSFYDLKFEDSSVDVIYMSQAFHHADKPIPLLVECDRVLKPGGRIILVGEHNITPFRILKRFVKTLLTKQSAVTDFHLLFPPDPIVGDHYYRRSDYYFMFHGMGYQLQHQVCSSGNAIFIADKI